MASTTTASKIPHVLLLGGHGKVSLFMTPLLLAKNWHVTSVIRKEAQKDDVLAAAAKAPATAPSVSSTWKENIKVLIHDLESVKSVADARTLFDRAAEESGGWKVDWVVFSAGAGATPYPSRTYALDRDASRYITSAALTSSHITRLLIVSGLISRRNRAPWWNDEDWASYQKQTKSIPTWTDAKVQADEWASVKVHERNQQGQGKKEGFAFIDFRPGTLSDEAPTGKVGLGRTGKGVITRGDTAAAAVELLASASADGSKGGVRGWIDAVQGETPIKEEVERLAATNGGEDAILGEDWEGIVNRVRKVEKELEGGSDA